jgi:hypothetical protein
MARGRIVDKCTGQGEVRDIREGHEIVGFNARQARKRVVF